MTTAILMAAGSGTRISRKIHGNCKCTLDIGGIPLIRYTVQMLIDNHIDVHIVVGYNAEHIVAALDGLHVTFHTSIFLLFTSCRIYL